MTLWGGSQPECHTFKITHSLPFITFRTSQHVDQSITLTITSRINKKQPTIGMCTNGSTATIIPFEDLAEWYQCA